MNEMKRHMKRMLAAAVTAAMLLTSLSGSAFAAEIPDEGASRTEETALDAAAVADDAADEAPDEVDDADIAPDDSDPAAEDPDTEADTADEVSDTDTPDGATHTVYFILTGISGFKYYIADSALTQCTGEPLEIEDGEPLKIAVADPAGPGDTFEPYLIDASINGTPVAYDEMEGGFYFGEITKDSVISLTSRARAVLSVKDPSGLMMKLGYILSLGEDTLHEGEADFSASEASIEGQMGSSISLCWFDDDKTCTLVKRVILGTEELATDDRGYYTTGELTVSQQTLTIETIRISENDIKVSNVSADGITVGVAPSSLVDFDGTDYITYDDDLKLTVDTSKAGSSVTKLEYALKDSAEKKEALDAGGYYIIPQIDVMDAILAGGLTLTATLEENPVITVRKDPSGAAMAYTEYKVIKDDDGNDTYVEAKPESPLIFTGDTVQISANKGHVIALKVTPKGATASENAYLLTKNSVKSGDTPIAVETSGALAGKYPIPADTDRTVTVQSYRPVGINIREAEDRDYRTASDNWTLTNTQVVGGKTPRIPAAEGAIVTSAGTLYITSALVDDYYAKGGTIAVKDSSGKEYRVKQTGSNFTVDVEEAIEAGRDITITAKARALELTKVTVSMNEKLDHVTVCDYGSALEKEKGEEPIKSLNVTSGSVYVRKGGYIDLRGIMKVPGDRAEITFLRFTRADGMFLGYAAGYAEGTAYPDLALGTLTRDIKLKVDTAKLPATGKIRIDEGSYTEGGVRKAWTESVIYPDCKWDDLIKSTDAVTQVIINLRDNDPVYSYRVGSTVTCTVSGGSTQEVTVTHEKTTWGVTQIICRVPFRILAEAAFAPEGALLTLRPTVHKAGYKDPYISFEKEDAVRRSVKENGEPQSQRANPVKYFEYPISYGGMASVEIAPVPGSRLTEAYYLSRTKADEKKKEIQGSEPVWTDAMQTEMDSWIKDTAASKAQKLTPENDGKVRITLKALKESLYFRSFTVPEYTLTVLGKKASSGDTFDIPFYCEGIKPPIQVVSGNRAINLGTDSDWAVKAWDVSNSGDVTDLAFPDRGAGDEVLEFTTDPVMYGRMIKVTLSSNRVGGYEIYFHVGSPASRDDVSFDAPGDLHYTLGTVGTYPLNVANGFDLKTIRVELTSESHAHEYFETNLTDDKVEIRRYWSLPLPKPGELSGLKLVIKDNLDDHVVDERNLVVTADQVVSANLAPIQVTAGHDTIHFDFSGVSGIDRTTAGLYYLINAVRKTDSDEYKENVENLAVSVTRDRYDLPVIMNDDSDETKPIEYEVTVRLVQFGKYSIYTSEDDIVARSTNVLSSLLSTEAAGTYAAKISIEKNKNLPKKLFDTMSDIEIGTVKYAALSRDTYPTVQRLTRVEVLSPTGKVYDSINKPKVIREDEGRIIFSPAEMSYRESTGKMVITAYAAQPKGHEVTARFTVNIRPGIKAIDIDAPKNIFKAAGKKAAIKAGVVYTGRIGAVKPAVRKVVWSLTQDEEGEVPFTYKGISIKNGKVTLAKSVTIPEGGLAFYIHAVAADYAGRRDAAASAEVRVRSTSKAPAYIMLDTDSGHTNKKEMINGQSYYASDLVGWFSACDSSMEPLEDVTFKVTGLKRRADDLYYPTGMKKTVTITAIKTDGSGLKKTVKIRMKSDKGLKVMLTDAAGSLCDILEKTAEDKYEAVNTLPAEHPMGLLVTGTAGTLITHSVSFKGVKKIKTVQDDGGTYYSLTPTARNAQIILTEKATGKKVEISVTNKALPAAGVRAAAKVTAESGYISSYNAKNAKKGRDPYVRTKAKGKIFNVLNYSDIDAYNRVACNRVTYTVKNGVPSGSVLICTKDSALIAFYDMFAENSPECIKLDDGLYEMELDADRRFVVDYVDTEGKLEMKAGKHVFTVTPVDEEGYATAKSSKVTLVASPAPGAQVVPAVTAFKNYGDPVELTFKTMKNIAFPGISGTAGTSAGYPGEFRGANIGGNISAFGSFFRVEDSKLCCMKQPDDPEKPQTGWIRYVWTNLDGSEGSAWARITVSPAAGGAIVVN